MDASKKQVWGIHTRDDGLFLNNSLIAIGWPEMGDLSKIPSDRESFRAKMEESFPEKPKQSIANMTGQVYRFAVEMQIGDYVVFPSGIDRMVNIGVVEGDYYYHPDRSDNMFDYDNRRKVKWIKHVPRTDFSQGALHELGAAMSLFMLRNYADDFLSVLDANYKSKEDDPEDETVAATAKEIQYNTTDFIIKELRHHLKGYDLEPFVANLLNAMGYRTTVAQHGGDGGIDIIAYKDELPPRIVVQVKSQDSDITESTVQSLKGAMMPGDYGLFVTLSNYTKNAQKFLDANPIIRGINGIELADIILDYYDKLDEKYQRIIPLKKVYIPVADDE